MKMSKKEESFEEDFICKICKNIFIGDITFEKDYVDCEQCEELFCINCINKNMVISSEYDEKHNIIGRFYYCIECIIN